MSDLEKKLQFEFDCWAGLYLLAFERKLPELAGWAARKLWATHLTATERGVNLVIPDA